MKYMREFPDPKLPWRKKLEPTLSNYYAGFSIEFASEMIKTYTEKDAIVLDPWNGAGTTTFAAALAGRHSVGIDLNPAAILIAKARLASCEIFSAQAENIIDGLSKGFRVHKISSDNDNILTDWLDQQSATYIQGLIKKINGDFGFAPPLNVLEISNEHALILRILAGVLKEKIKPLTGSNPTWIRLNTSSEKLRIKKNDFLDAFVGKIRDYQSILEETHSPSVQYAPQFICADTTKFSFPDNFDLILGSPPYCTRIDYAVKTLPEASVLGISKEYTLGEFRRSILGSTITSKSDQLFPPPDYWGKKCTEFLEQVFSHPSKASSTYYYRFHYRYFSGLFSSIKHALNALKPGGHFAIVIQDSYYKEIHNDLPKIVQEIFEIEGAQVVQRQDFINNGSFSLMNSASAAYGKGKKYSESVIVARK